MKKSLLVLCGVILVGALATFAIAQQSGPISDDMTGKSNFSYTANANLFYDGTYLRRWTGASAGADGVSNSTAAPWTSTMCYGFNGTTWDRLYVLGTQADAQATSVNGLVTTSFLYGYNGTTFDMLRIGASNELQVTDIATRAGEDSGNDWRKVKTESIATNTVTKTATAVDSAGTDVVVDSILVLGYTNFCVGVDNLGGGGAAALNNVQIQTSFDNSAWSGDLGWTACDTLASADPVCVYCVSGNGYNYVRVVASTAASDTTVTGWISLNKG